MVKLTDTTAFPAATSLQDDAAFYTVDDSTGTPVDKSIQIQHLVAHNRHFASIHVTGATASQSVSADTYTKLTAFTTNGLANGATAVYGSDKISTTKTGIYKVQYSLSVYTGTAATVHAAVYAGGSIQNTGGTSAGKIEAGFTQQIGGVAYIDVTTAATDIEIYMKSTHTAFIVAEGVLTIERVMNT